MDVVEILPDLYQLPFPVGNAYLWRDRDGLTLVDTGLPGSGPAVAEAIRDIGSDVSDLRRVFLTHFHEDHVGSAAEVASWGPVEVVAHRADAPFVRGERTGPPPVPVEDWERELFERVRASLAAVPAPDPVRVDREVDDGDVLGVGGGARVVAVPGHTPGSAALYLPGPRVLFAGDTVARGLDGQVRLGVFNADPAGAVASLRRQAELDVEVACFGHGAPVTSDASAALRVAADTALQSITP